MTSKKQRTSEIEAESGPAAIDREPYAAFAEIYDEYMQHVPYSQWARYLLRRFRDLQGRAAPSVVDLACGTGLLLEHFPLRLKRRGLDASAAMLERARRRLPRLQLEQAPLDGRWNLCDASQAFLVCTHDSLNYLLEPERVLRHFEEVRRVLVPGGLYSTDIVTLSNILENFAGQTLEYRVAGRRLVWKNRYDSESRLMESDLEFYSRQGGGRQVERHRQRYYDLDELRQLAGQAGLELLAIEGDYQARPHRQHDYFWNLHLRRTD